MSLRSNIKTLRANTQIIAKTSFVTVVMCLASPAMAQISPEQCERTYSSCDLAAQAAGTFLGSPLTWVPIIGKRLARVRDNVYRNCVSEAGCPYKPPPPREISIDYNGGF